MQDVRKMLLVVMVFTALYCKVTTKELDMALDAVDDLYVGSREEALKKLIHSGLLKQELNRSMEFKAAWSSIPQCSKLIPGKMTEHTAALLAYANGGAHFSKTFNDAVETFGVNVTTYENLFHFKSLHFLLMDSMTALPEDKCKTMYAVTEEKYTAKKGLRVRFGRFSVVYSNFSELKKWEDFDGQVLLNITSCFFANLGANICSEEDKALLSPAEVFTVEDVNSRVDDNESEYTEIILKHLRVEALNQCFSWSPVVVSTRWLVLLLVALTVFL